MMVLQSKVLCITSSHWVLLKKPCELVMIDTFIDEETEAHSGLVTRLR